MTTGFTRLLAALLLVNALILPAGLHLVFGVPKADTVLWHTEWLLRGFQTADSWKPMETARAHLEQPNGVPLYQQVFFIGGTKFLYPPTSLLFVEGLSRDVLNLLSRAAVLLLAICGALLFTIAVRAVGSSAIQPAGRADAALRIGIVAAMGLTYYPVVKAYTLGQIQTWINAGFGVMLLAASRNRDGLCGALLGCICLIKPQWGLLLLWAIAARRWRLVLAAIAVGAAALGLSVARFGAADHLDYLNVVGFIAARGEAFYANQSVTGALNRWFANGDSLVWHPDLFPPQHRAVQLWSIAALALLIVGSWAVALRAGNRGDRVIGLGIVALAVTIGSPVAWEHHYGILFPILAVATPRLMAERPLGRATLPVLVTAYVVSSHYWPQANRFAGSWLNPLQSYLLWAAIGVFLLLWALLAEGRAGGVAAKLMFPVADRRSG